MAARARRAATKAPIIIDSDTESEKEASDPEGIFSSPEVKPKVKRAIKRSAKGSDDDSDFDEFRLDIKPPVKRRTSTKAAESPAKKAKAEPKPKAPRKPREPKAPKEPKTVTKVPKEPKVPKAPKEPKAPKVPKAPKEPKPKTTAAKRVGRKKAVEQDIGVEDQSVLEVEVKDEPQEHVMEHNSMDDSSAYPVEPEQKPVKHEQDSRPKYKKRISMTVRDQWDDHELLAEMQNIDRHTARNIIRLFEEENTIPFICRYRRELIGDMSPDDLRDVKLAYNQILSIKLKADTIIKNLEKEEKLTEDIKLDLLSAKSVDELDHMYAPFKPANKGSLADRAKALGLESYAEGILIGSLPQIDLPKLVKPAIEGLETVEKVEEGIKHLMAYNFSKNTAVLEEIRRLITKYDIVLSSSQMKSRPGRDKSEANNNGAAGASGGIAGLKRIPKKVDEFKYEHYFSFSCTTKYLRPHQIMALNRGENQKVLSIKLQFKDQVKGDLYWFLKREYLQAGTQSRKRTELFEASFDEAFTKKLIPLMTRTVRSELTKRAERASVEVFANNLKQLLLTGPVKGEKILGIDPGFSNGCKLALISECGDLLDSTTVYPHVGGERSKVAPGIIAKIMSKHNCNLIALGNGTACRETESMLSYMLEEGILDKRWIRYCIVPEQGASIYSCSEIAKKEFPKMDVNLISAVSIARRLQDPLCEYVKIEPRHLGVGMYQHDLNEKSLSETLDEVVMECVSFVGVDINTASVSLLSHVAGLTAKRAEHIVTHRTRHGPFRSREQLLKVKFIGDKTFTQCAGFIRIEPLTAGIQEYNLLDSTWVHPESYDLAESIISKAGLSNKEIGRADFILGIREFTFRTSKDTLTNIFEQPIERIECVLSALQRDLLRDYRADVNKPPMFKKGLTSMNDLTEGTVLTGAVNNVTDFGAFVDIGVENNGLIHRTKMNGKRVNIGDRVEVTVISIDIAKGRLGLKLEQIL